MISESVLLRIVVDKSEDAPRRYFLQLLLGASTWLRHVNSQIVSCYYSIYQITTDVLILSFVASWKAWGSHSGGYEDFCLLGCLYSVESQPTFRNNLLRLYLGLKSGSACYLLYAGVLLSEHFNPEDGGDMLLWNASLLSTDYTVL
jgi:hypothetical protein